jgi:hypothetical protein
LSGVTRSSGRFTVAVALGVEVGIALGVEVGSPLAFAVRTGKGRSAPPGRLCEVAKSCQVHTPSTTKSATRMLAIDPYRKGRQVPGGGGGGSEEARGHVGAVGASGGFWARAASPKGSGLPGGVTGTPQLGHRPSTKVTGSRLFPQLPQKCITVFLAHLVWARSRRNDGCGMVALPMLLANEPHDKLTMSDGGELSLPCPHVGKHARACSFLPQSAVTTRHGGPRDASRLVTHILMP